MELTFDPRRDPLRILETTLLALDDARYVSLDAAAIETTAEQLLAIETPAPDWGASLHPPARNEAELANLVLVVDALNFCFWSVPNAPKPRWQVTYDGTTYDGYLALAAALRRAVEAGYPLADAEFLATLTEDDTTAILAGD